jgi:phosphoglycerol transferase MdoB-like AlkP superfamily enzyme
MISSLSILFLVTCYFYFKQYYEKLMNTQIKDAEERKLWKDKLTKKLMIIPVGVVAVIVLYIISFTLMRLYPDVENVKSSRRVVDVVAALACVGIFFMDKRELDKRLATDKDKESGQ